MRYLIANWKSHKNLKSADVWTEKLAKHVDKIKKIREKLTGKEIALIVCPPYTLIHSISEKLGKIPNCYTGAQDISMFNEGSYTGEVAAEALFGLAEYVIVGHSERRRYFNESDETVGKKISIAASKKLKTVQCVRNENDIIYKDATMIAYEPVEAIGTGKNASAEDVLRMKKKLKLSNNQVFLYGGSVDKTNCQNYLTSGGIDGFLIGGASLEPESFLEIASLA